MKYTYPRRLLAQRPLLAQAAEAIPGSRWECDPEFYAEAGIQLVDALGRPIAYADPLAWSLLAAPGSDDVVEDRIYTRSHSEGASYDDCARAVLRHARTLTRALPRATV